MSDTLLLVDYENVPKIDLSILDEACRAIIFVGKNQVPPKAAKRKASAHRFLRVDFQKIEGSGRNALDFHIAFHLGRMFETSPTTECVVIAKDKGYDPLVAHLNKSGMTCRRVENWEALVSERAASRSQPVQASSPSSSVTPEPDPGLTVCQRCKKSTTIEHYGGRWCSNCGGFAAPPKPHLLPSARIEVELEDGPEVSFMGIKDGRALRCGWCHRETDMTGGIYDDGDWMCGECVAGYAS